MNISKQIISTANTKHLTIATAESITGGRIASQITSITGSSKIFTGGVVCYSEHSKIHSAGVDVRLINKTGVYSDEVVAQMAERIAKRNQAYIGVSTSGCAEEGDENCPKGRVYFGYFSKKNGTHTEIQHFEGTREEIQSQASDHALTQLFKIINEY